MTPDQQNKIRDYVDQQHKAQVEFLAELVKVPSDNPPGDCAPHAKRSAELLEKLGFTVERHDVPDDLVKANGMISATNLVDPPQVRPRSGRGAQCAWRCRAAGRGLVVGPLWRRRSATASCMAVAWRSPSPTSPLMLSR